MIRRILEVIFRTLLFTFRTHWLGFVASCSGVKFTIGEGDFILWAAGDYRVIDPNTGQRVEAGSNLALETMWFKQMHMLLRKQRWVRKPKNHIGFYTMKDGSTAYEVLGHSLLES